MDILLAWNAPVTAWECRLSRGVSAFGTDTAFYIHGGHDRLKATRPLLHIVAVNKPIVPLDYAIAELDDPYAR